MCALLVYQLINPTIYLLKQFFFLEESFQNKLVFEVLQVTGYYFTSDSSVKTVINISKKQKQM